jgi:hypothetical protein
MTKKHPFTPISITSFFSQIYVRLLLLKAKKKKRITQQHQEKTWNGLENQKLQSNKIMKNQNTWS